MRIEPPTVRRGDPITAALMTQMAAAVRSCRILRGTGTRPIEMPDGTIINCAAGGQTFAHPWQPSMLGESAATFLPGTVNRVPATIKGVPLDGDAKKGAPPPRLSWSALKLDADGVGYFCAEITCDPKQDWAVLKVEIVQVADPDTPDGSPGRHANASGAAVPLPGNRARQPLAMLRRQKGGRLDVHDITFFDLQHRVHLSADGKGAGRHFFW